MVFNLGGTMFLKAAHIYPSIRANDMGFSTLRVESYALYALGIRGGTARRVDVVVVCDLCLAQGP